MIVRIPSPLRSYTSQRSEVNVDGTSVYDVLANLDRAHPGIRFRMIDEQDKIRQHIKIFVNNDAVSSLDKPVGPKDTIHIIAALSGG